KHAESAGRPGREAETPVFEHRYQVDAAQPADGGTVHQGIVPSEAGTPVGKVVAVDGVPAHAEDERIRVHDVDVVDVVDTDAVLRIHIALLCRGRVFLRKARAASGCADEGKDAKQFQPVQFPFLLKLLTFTQVPLTAVFSTMV